ncbi:MAG TPA: YwiC-like family protein, partial [Actinomycetes bacterium]|nr:YwiC-like family protein [Actinomycetes bacterium]
PPQHGAWAFLGLPLVLGAIVAPFDPLFGVLAVAWVAAYPLSYAAFGLVRARRPQRFRRPFAVWLAVVLPAALVLLVARPWLVWVGLGYLLPFAVNLRYAQRNDERALENDLVFVVECALVVPVMWAVAVGDQSWTPPSLADVPTDVWVMTIVCALVLIGSTLHVKSLIRERRDARYATASRAFAVACVVASMGLALWWELPAGLWLVLPFLALAVRAFVVGRKPLRPGVLGVIELACFLLVAACAALAST